MENLLFYNTKRDKVDFKPFLGLYNIFILCKTGCIIVRSRQISSPGKSGALMVLPRTMPVTDINYLGDADADVLFVSDYFLDLYRPNAPWEVKGYKYLSYMSFVFSLKNEFFDEQKTIENDFNLIKERIGNSGNYLEEEIVGSLLRIFLCDFWRVYFRKVYTEADRGLPSKHFAKFLVDIQRECKTQRDVSWYAKELGISPKYLTEISNYASGRPASDWIDYYTARTLRRELFEKDLSLSKLAKEMHFSSLPAFTRYVKRVLGCSPSEFRESVDNRDLPHLQKLLFWSVDDEYLSEISTDDVE